MKFLFLFLLLTSNSFASYEKVKEVNGIKIPKGITAKKDSLEGGYCVYYNSVRFSGTLPHELSIRIKGNDDKFYTVVETHTAGADSIWVDSVTIYVENNETQKYSYKWSKRMYDYISGNYKPSREYDYTVNKDLEKFLIDNIQEKSKITVRFHGKSYTRTEELSKDIGNKSIVVLRWRYHNPKHPPIFGGCFFLNIIF